MDFHLRQKLRLLLRQQGCNFKAHKGQVSAERVVEGIKDGPLMVASDTANKHTQSNRRKITMRLGRLHIRL